jgi:hypothetical protein
MGSENSGGWLGGSGCVSPETSSKGNTISGSGREFSINYSASIDASRSSSIYGNSTAVQPSSLNLNVLIKY